MQQRRNLMASPFGPWLILGLLTMVGESTAQSGDQTTTQSISTLKAQAVKGDALAQDDLANAYYDGKGTPQDYAQALYWYLRAADQGLADAEYSVGILYNKGEGVTRDYAKAAGWWRKAAQQGNYYAQHNLGIAYRDGKGVPQSASDAYFWLDIAAAGKMTDEERARTVEARDNAASHLTKTVLLQTQERARKWLDSHPLLPKAH